jgi:small-conductance mechanosensitive channel
VIRLLQIAGFAFLLLNGAAGTSALSVAPAHAQDAAPKPLGFNQQIDDWRRTLDRVQAELGHNTLAGDALDQLRVQVEAVRQAALAARATAEGERKPLSDQLAALGSEPAKGQPPEPADVARTRRQLADQVAAITARVRQCELTLARAANLSRTIASVGNAQFTEHLLERETPPLALASLGAAAHATGEIATSFANAPLEWWNENPIEDFEPTTLVSLALVVVIALGAGWPLRNWLLRRYGRTAAIADPSYARRSLAAVAEGVARGLLPAAGLLALAGVLLGEEIVTELLAEMVRGMLVGGIFFSLTSALARSTLAPDAPAWRIVPFGADASRTLARRVSLLAAVAGVTIGFHIAAHEFEPGARAFFGLFDLVLNTAIAGVTFTLLPRRLWQPEADASRTAAPTSAEQHHSSWTWPLLRLVAGVALVASPILALAGYHNLANHIVSRVVITGLFGGAFILVRTLLRELIALLAAPRNPISIRLRAALAIGEQGGKYLAFWLGVALDLVLILLAAALALRLWGVPDEAIGLWVGGALHGFELGNLHFSLGDIALAILVFVAFWTATRLIQRVLREKLLPQTRLDPGVRHSLSAVVGYIGFVIAFGLAITTLGLSFSNIAIIAGALSVGIGFGLQNIVNNFVSGLILLIERPVKVGDWVVVGPHQGFVTRISVRATEIQTFERASVIVPNSELISGAVVNWTHRDKYGRVDIKIGVAYGSDTEKVRELLLAAAKQHKMVVTWPVAHVLFRDFGDSALNFELRCYVSDVEKHLFVASDLRFAVDAAFRAAKVEIPFPQRDINIRNIDALAEALAARRDAKPEK